ncbi:hypothetical protein [Pantoea sp. RHCKP32]|uniref:hypothetical protein n=1 Tax=Pantoea sp. RHCKP32 TaxID=3425182 RepID=UPI003DA19CBC
MKKDRTENRDYPVKENILWVRREWRIQRAGEYLLIVLVLLGACGLFSKGWLSDSRVRSPDGNLEVAYERFGRIESNMAMRIGYRAPAGDRFTLTIGSGALDSLEIQTLQPQPREAEAIGSDLRLTFAVADTGPDHAVWIGLQPRRAGRIHVAIYGDDASPIRFTQWIYP